MYLYHSDTQTTGPHELERPRGNRLHCCEFLCDLCQVFWLEICPSHAGNAVEKNKNWHFTAFKIVKFPLPPNMVGLFFKICFFSQTLTIHRTAGEGEAVFLIPLYHFHLLHRYLDISRVIPAESSALEWYGSL